MTIACTLALALSAATAAAQPPATSPSPSAVSPSATAGQSPSPAPAASPSVKPFLIERWTWGMDADGPAPVRTVEVRNDFGDIRVRFAGDRRTGGRGAWRLTPGTARGSIPQVLWIPRPSLRRYACSVRLPGP